MHTSFAVFEFSLTDFYNTQGGFGSMFALGVQTARKTYGTKTKNETK